MKTIVKANGMLNLLEPVTGEFISESRAHCVTWTPFLEARTGAGQLTVLASNLSNDATDAELEAVLQESDEELAVAFMVSTYPYVEPEQVPMDIGNPVVQPEPEPEPKKKGK